MQASATVVAERRGDHTVLAELADEPPWGLRPVPGGVAMVGTAAGPVGGDELSLRIEVGPGATLALESVAATMLWPGRDGAASRTSISVTVAEGGTLRWWGRPLVSVAGSIHHQEVTIELAPDARLDLREELALGRTGEAAGRVVSRWRVTRVGSPLLDQRQILDPTAPGWATTAGAGGHRHLVQHLEIGPPAPPPATTASAEAAAARFPIAGDAVLRLAGATSAPRAHRALLALA